MDDLVSILITCLSCGTALIGLLTTLYTKIKLKKFKASTSTVSNDQVLNEYMIKLIEDAENTYKLLKARGIDTSGLKKDYVLTRLQMFALEKNYTYDSTIWVEKLEKMIVFSKTVNSK